MNRLAKIIIILWVNIIGMIAAILLRKIPSWFQDTFWEISIGEVVYLISAGLFIYAVILMKEEFS